MRHAFMIMAHNQFEILIKTLHILDDENIDFFIHIDKKCKAFPKDEVLQACNKSRIYFINRISVAWGGYSLIKCTLLLMENASKGKYDYYHLISGVDLPIKRKADILGFFENNPKKQYIHFEQNSIQPKYFDRIKYHYFFQDTGKRIFKIFNLVIRTLEKILGVDRTKHNIVKKFQYGANWFSITHELVEYVLTKQDWIRKTFKYAYCGDELFIQTIVVNSSFVDQLSDRAFDGDYISCLRYIDWKRGNPYVFRKEDFKALIDSPFLFARKFDLRIDADIVDEIYTYYRE